MDDIARLAKWWGSRHGFHGKPGGYIYRNDLQICQGWHSFWRMTRRRILTSEPPRTGTIRITHRVQRELALRERPEWFDQAHVEAPILYVERWSHHQVGTNVTRGESKSVYHVIQREHIPRQIENRVIAVFYDQKRCEEYVKWVSATKGIRIACDFSFGGV